MTKPNRDREGAPTKGDEDAMRINSWQAKAPAPRLRHKVGQAFPPANSVGKD
jgi:hypothetical protein